MNIKVIKKLIAYIFLGINLLGLSSCSQLGSLQTARTLEPEDIEFGGAIYGYGVADSSPSGGDLGPGIFPYGEVYARYGLADNLDAGLKLSSSGSVLLDGKFQFLGGQTDPFAMAIGAGFEYQIPFPEQEATVYRIHLPLYLSYHFNEDNAIYATPRFTIQNVSDDDNDLFVGSAIGYERQLSSQINGVLEAGYYLPLSDNQDDINLYQIAIGIKYRLP